MSAERRWDERRFKLESSITQGGPTTFIEHMTPGTTVPPHFHTRFSETFELVSGSMNVFICPSNSVPTDSSADGDGAIIAALESSAQALEVGVPVTVSPKLPHMYLSGSESTVLRVTLSPGDADFERLLKVMNGLAADGELEALGNSEVLMAVVMELSDAHLLGPGKQMLDGVWKEKRAEVLELRKKVLEKYDNEEQLKNLLAN